MIMVPGEQGVALAESLALPISRREGHDLAGACVACASSDAFRLHAEKGVAHCFSCGGKWSPFQLAEFVTRDREQAKSLMIELGFFQSAPGRDGHLVSSSPIESIARKKGITVDALRAFGAKDISATAIQLPCYGADGKPCTTFSISTRSGTKGSKGVFAKGKPAGLFFPHVNGEVRLPQPGETWYVVEGPKDAAALYALGYLACGMNTSRLAAKYARLFIGVRVILVPDRDRAGEQGAQQSGGVLHGVTASTRIAVLPAEFQESKGEDVRDVLRRNGGQEQLMGAFEGAQPWRSAADDADELDRRAEVEVTPDEICVNDQVIAALERDQSLFQRSGVLVQVQHDHGPQKLKGISRPASAPRIVPLKEATLRERLTAAVKFVMAKQAAEGEQLIQVHPPAFCIAAVLARGHWPEVRHLEGVISSPILRGDGTLLQAPGYDASTGLFYEPLGTSFELPVSPTREGAVASVTALLDVVADFPFSTFAHRSAWLALVLTPLARYAFRGPSPLFLIDANTRGSGKSLLADAAATIVTGRTMPRMAYPEDDAEMRKRITALVLGGDQFALLDNIAGDLGSASLDAALTGDVWKDRILGRSELVEMPLTATWAATGNNVILKADTSRRVCHIRLDSKLERPEERGDFRHPKLLAWVRRERPRLLSAALQILLAYCRAGRPDQHLSTWGSFEGWSDLVRQAIVWSGLPDPAESREALAVAADREAGSLRALVEGWGEVDPENGGLTAAKLIELLDRSPESYELFRNAVLELCFAPQGKLPSSRSLGNKLRHLRGRVVAGKAIEKRDQHGTAVWFVAEVVQTNADSRNEASRQEEPGCSGCFSCSDSSPASSSIERAPDLQDGGNRDENRPGAEQPNQPEQPEPEARGLAWPSLVEEEETTILEAAAGEPGRSDRPVVGQEHVDWPGAWADFALLLEPGDLPPELRLSPEAVIIDPRTFLHWLQADIRRGPTGPRAITGSLQADLRQLRHALIGAP